jgi:hypothetical protein
MILNTIRQKVSTQFFDTLKIFKFEMKYIGYKKFCQIDPMRGGIAIFQDRLEESVPARFLV